MNIIDTHMKQMQKFKNLQSTLPKLQEELKQQLILLRQYEDDILEQRKAATKYWMLEKRKNRTEKEELEYQEAKKTKNEKTNAYDMVTKTKDVISQLERRINNIASKQEEIEFIEKTAFILAEYDKLENAQRSGMPQSISKLPQYLECVYKSPIVTSINSLFVTKERRPIFNKTHSLEPHFTAKNLKTLYCLFLKNCLTTSYDLSIDDIIMKKGIVYLTEYHLLFPEQHDKTLDEVIRYYKIPLKQNLEIFIEYPDENSYISNEHEKLTTRKELFDEYKQIIGLNPRKIKRQNEVAQICKRCNNDNGLIEDTHNAQLICGKCGLVVTNKMTAKGYQGIPYGEEKQVCIRKSDYKPIMHLRDIIKQRQAIESFIVPDEVIGLIDTEREKCRIKPELLNVDIVREWLKKLSKRDVNKQHNFPKYYKYINQIILKLGGPAPVRYTYEDEKAIEFWFQKLEKVFKVFIPLYGPNSRSNLFSYNYILRRICLFIAYYQHNEEEQDWWLEHAKTWPLLKDDKKLFTYESTMRKICEVMNEPFFPLVD